MGKSTLLNIQGGLDAPTSGTARWREHELTGASDAALTTYRREHVGFVFQFWRRSPGSHPASSPQHLEAQWHPFLATADLVDPILMDHDRSRDNNRYLATP